jgi:hypothetical protein
MILDGSIVVVSAVDPLARRSAPWVNRGRNSFRCGGVELSIRRWVNIIAHRSREIISDEELEQQTAFLKVATYPTDVSTTNARQIGEKDTQRQSFLR